MPEELPILYRDEHIVVIDKPPGLLVHRSEIDRHETRFALPTFEVSLIRHRRDDNNAMLNWFESELHLWCRTQSEL